MPMSVVEQFTVDRSSSCSYCKTGSASRYYGMFAHILTVEDYQALIDRGWRRSGIYCYKPIMDETCCPAYTIKCDATNFKVSKSQKKILNKFNRFLKNEEDCTDEGISDIKPESNKEQSKGNICGESSASSSKSNQEDKAGIKKGLGADPNRAPCKKAKLVRLEKKQAKLKAKNMDVDEVMNVKPQNHEKSLEDFLMEIPEDVRNRLQIKLVRTAPPSNEWKATYNVSHKLYQKYQTIVHGDPPQKCSKKQFERFLVQSPLKIKLVRNESEEFSKTFQTSAALYKLYQMRVHNDSVEECDPEEFKQFLVNTPLEAETRDSLEFGSFHQQYWLDGNLIAVGVIDILPKCVSSVYFFYDPDYGNLTLGTYGALREIGFTRTLSRLYPAIQYYYMGFYIHSCPKMRYKSNYSPSHLLCPETFEWYPIKECIEKLNREPYTRFNPDIDAVDKDEFNNVNKLVVLNAQDSVCVHYGWLKSKSGSELRGELSESRMLLFGKLIGNECSRRIILAAKFQ